MKWKLKHKTLLQFMMVNKMEDNNLSMPKKRILKEIAKKLLDKQKLQYNARWKKENHNLN